MTSANAAQNVGAASNSLSQLQVNLGTALGGAQTLTVTLYDVTAAAAQAVTCTVPNTGTTCSDTIDSYSVPAGDLLAWQLVLNSTTATENIAIGATVGSASTFTGNTTTAVSADSGFSSAAAGTPIVLDGSGNAQISAPSSTVGQGGVWSSGLPLGGPGNPGGSSGTPVSGTGYAQQLNLTFPTVIGHATFDVVTCASCGTVVSVCVYNAAGTSVVWPVSGTAAQTGTINAPAIESVSATQATLEPGIYEVFFEQVASTTAAVIQTYTAGAAVSSSIANQNGHRSATTANVISGTSCPSSLGTLTGSTAAPTQTMLALEP
jgi:hypothetical protein